MDANYKKLWKLLIDKDLKKTDLIDMAGVTSNIIAKIIISLRFRHGGEKITNLC